VHFPVLKKIEVETQFSCRAFFSIFNTRHREITRNASSVPRRVAYQGLHVGKGVRKKEKMREGTFCASSGKIIVKSREASRATEGKNKPGCIREPDDAARMQRGWAWKGRGECAAAVRHPRFISCSVSRGKLQRRSRFPLRMHFKRLRTNRKWHSRLYFSSCTLDSSPPVKIGLALPHNTRSLEGTTCFLNIFLSPSFAQFLSLASAIFYSYKYEMRRVLRNPSSPFA